MIELYLFEVFFILACFLFDCFLFFKLKNLSLRGAILNFLFWTAVTFLFFTIMYFEFSEVKSKEFLAGYLLERTLSLDNIFAFYVIFDFFKISKRGKERVLFWGIILTILLRVLFIFAGVTLVTKFSFLLYIFGGFLVFTGIKLLIAREEKNKDFAQHGVVKLLSKILPTTKQTNGDEFTIKINGKLFFTPVFILMLFIGFTDIIFALDSIPAIFGITLDPYIVITANFFSLMGLRAIFFLISHIIERFYYIKYALSAILVFIGIKMMLIDFYHIDVSASLAFIFLSITVSIILSLFKKNAGNS